MKKKKILPNWYIALNICTTYSNILWSTLLNYLEKGSISKSWKPQCKKTNLIWILSFPGMNLHNDWLNSFVPDIMTVALQNFSNDTLKLFKLLVSLKHLLIHLHQYLSTYLLLFFSFHHHNCSNKDHAQKPGRNITLCPID